MITDYIPVLLQIGFALFFATVAILFSMLIGQRGRNSKAKDTAYECGKDPITTTQPRFAVKFYMVAMLFILFDIELVFMYAWAVIYREQLAHGTAILFAMVPFILIFFVGELYAWKKGALDWVTRAPRS